MELPCLRKSVDFDTFEGYDYQPYCTVYGEGASIIFVCNYVRITLQHRVHKYPDFKNHKKDFLSDVGDENPP